METQPPFDLPAQLVPATSKREQVDQMQQLIDAVKEERTLATLHGKWFNWEVVLYERDPNGHQR